MRTHAKQGYHEGTTANKEVATYVLFGKEQRPALVWSTGSNKVSGNSNGKCDDAGNNEHPAPCGESEHTIEVAKGRGLNDPRSQGTKLKTDCEGKKVRPGSIQFITKQQARRQKTNCRIFPRDGRVLTDDGVHAVLSQPSGVNESWIHGSHRLRDTTIQLHTIRSKRGSVSYSREVCRRETIPTWKAGK